MIETMDPTTWITDQGDGFTCYENADGKSWVITGRCNSCGACEPVSAAPGGVTTQSNYIYVDGGLQTYTRTLRWEREQGLPGACVEEGYTLRKDIPITPDLVNNTVGCVLSGEWD